eukprot:gene1395-1811_t
MAEGLSEPIVWSVARGPDGRTWVGTNDGLSVFSQGRFEHILRGNQLPHPHAYNLLAEEGQVWIGTRRGLVIWKDGKLAAPPTLAPMAAHADAVDALKAFVQQVKTGRTTFTQTVTSPDGAKKKQSAGEFEFSRPNRFRFVYTKPYAQTIVSDGQKVWFHDPDLNQVTVRKLGDALGATPAALLAGQSLEKDFDLKAQPDSGGLEWAQATPKVKEGAIQWLKAGFKGKTLV